MTHSLIWDGDADHDFLSSLGLTFTVPLRAEPHDRHVRFAGADGGFLREAVRGLTGMRRDPGPEVREAQLAGRATPPADTWARDVGRLSKWIPTWSDYSLRQLSANGFGLRKRTAEGHAWIGVAEGTRSEGLVYLGDPAGGLSLCIHAFWQSFPSGLDVRNAATDEAEVTVWLYSPDGAADGRALLPRRPRASRRTTSSSTRSNVTYEDYEPGFGTPHGIARTSEPSAWAPPATPARPRRMPDSPRSTRCSAAAQLAALPERLPRRGLFGDWSLPDRSTPANGELEGQLDFLLRLLPRARSSSAAGTASGTTATSCTPTTPTGTPGATTSAATRGPTPSSRPTCGSGPRSSARARRRVPPGRGDDAARRRGRRLPPRPLRRPGHPAQRAALGVQREAAPHQQPVYRRCSTTSPPTSAPAT